MADTNLFWLLRGTYEQRKALLVSSSRDFLEAAILDSEYNAFIRSRANYGEGERDPHGRGLRVPYIGWFWRHVEFSDLEHIPIGDSGHFVGFMVNNKWDYPERWMTGDEARGAMAIIDRAMRANERDETETDILAELWPYMQTLKVAL